jgi:hypothetical protein
MIGSLWLFVQDDVEAAGGPQRAGTDANAHLQGWLYRSEYSEPLFHRDFINRHLWVQWRGLLRTRSLSNLHR